MTMLRQQQLIYADHKEEIAWLNGMIADLPKPVPPSMLPWVHRLLDRLDELMLAEKATLKDYP